MHRLLLRVRRLNSEGSGREGLGGAGLDARAAAGPLRKFMRDQLRADAIGPQLAPGKVRTRQT